MVAESVIAIVTALLGGLIAAGATLLGLFWRMGRAAGGDGDENPDGGVTNQRIDDLRDYLDRQFETVDQRFKTMQAQLDRRFTSVDGRIDTLDEDIARIEERVNELHTDTNE